MADGIELGKAYVQIIPSAKGISGAISREMQGETEEAGKTGGNHILATMGKTIAAGAAAIAAAAGALVSQSVKQFSEYEQLAGGAELMFGDAYDYVAQKAQNAYKTVQMSQSEYLAQANGFAVGLTNALGGNAQAAAELADRILTAEADIVAATGRDAESIQNAFNGIMRGNFTMLDNLGLGIAGTKAGMKEVIDSVNAWNKEQGNATKYQMGNVADMQAALVDYVQMQGLAGYASKEAGDTITGSLASVKAAWQNVLIAMSDDNADFGGSMDALVESAGGFMNNILPRVEIALKAVPQLVSKLAPIIIQELPGLIAELLPEVVSVATALIGSIVQELPHMVETLLPVIITSIMSLVNSLITMLPPLIKTLVPALVDGVLMLVDTLVNELPGIIQALLDAFIEITPVLIDGAVKMLMGIVDAIPVIIEALNAAMPSLVEGFVSIMMALVEALPVIIQALVDALPGIIDSILNFLTENIPVILDAAITLMMALVDAIPVIIDTLLGALPGIIDTLIAFLTENIPVLLDGAVQLFMAIVHAIPEIVKALATHLPAILTAVWNGLKSLGTMLWNEVLNPAIQKIVEWASSIAAKALEAGRTFLNNIGSFFKELPGNVYTWLLGVISKVVTWGKELGSKFLSIGGDALKGLWNGISNMADWVVQRIKGLGSTILGAIKGILGIHSPSTEFAYIGQMMDEGLAEGVDAYSGLVEDAVTDLADTATGTLQSEIAVSGSMDPTAMNVGGGRVYGKLLETAEAIYNKLDRMQIVLDSGELVGGISAKMDTALGNMQLQTARGLIV